MRLRLVLSFVLISALFFVYVPQVLAGSATLTVSSSPEQTFKSFGFSETLDDNPWFKHLVNSGNQDSFGKATFEDLSAQHVRWWLSDTADHSGPDTFGASFVTSGAMAAARAHGVQSFLLAPGSLPVNTISGGNLSNVSLFAQTLAGNIKYMQDKFNIKFEATGLQNEPGSSPNSGIPVNIAAATVKAVRSAMDSQGLQSVKLIAPESASADDGALQWARALDADPAAAKALSGFATHSYNMAATPEIAAIVRKNNWDYWQTEAGGDASGEDVSARFLNDINNRVTHWTFFIGPATSPNDMELLSPSAKSFTYYYMQNMANHFLPGTIMRHITSSLDGGEMVFTYGQKPHLNAAAGVRLDGKWVIGVVNIADSNPGWAGAQYYSAEDFDVTVNVPELAGKGAQGFEVCRSHNSDAQMKCGENVTMQNGQVSVHLKPKELVTLVAGTASGPVGAAMPTPTATPVPGQEATPTMTPPPGGGGIPTITGNPNTTCRNVLDNTNAIPENFAAGWNLFSGSHELILKASCSGASVTIDAGSGQDTQYIYKDGYERNSSGDWVKTVHFSGEQQSGDWFVGSAHATITKTTQQLSDANEVAAYICSKVNGAWKCGCRDGNSCTDRGYWVEQVFQK